MKLENERLHITFAESAFINTLRFDHTAVVTQVMLDGKYQFCTPEQILPGKRSSQGIGLCGEFVIDTAKEAKAGEWFFKPGVGLLKQMKDYQTYDIWNTYEVQHFSVTAESIDSQTVSFYQKGIPCNGYGMDIRKTFHLQDNQLILNIEVLNTGSKDFVLKEYQHNFIALDNLTVEQGYVLELPCDKNILQIENKTLRQGDEITLPSAVYVQDNEIYWKRNMDGRVLYHASENVRLTPPYYWILRHQESPVSVREETDFCPSRIDVWAVEHCISTELYHTLQLIPGASAHWQRTWIFYNSL